MWTLKKVDDESLQPGYVVKHTTERDIALSAQDAAYTASSMAVVNRSRFIGPAFDLKDCIAPRICTPPKLLFQCLKEPSF